MLGFCVRHKMHPTIVEFPFEKMNRTIWLLKEVRARLGVILKKEERLKHPWMIVLLFELSGI